MEIDYSLHVGISMDTFAKNLNNVMTQKGLTAKDIQQALHLGSVQAVYNWMEGKRIPNMDDMLGLAHILDSTVEQLLSPVYREEKRYDPHVWSLVTFEKPFDPMDSKEADPRLLEYLYLNHRSRRI